ncbi:hypothetical protein C0995_006869 [Termitomyces sp. Mi166|nr:hypothetical protein C0995_006869 [Termitomyces sp. Mi166\
MATSPYFAAVRVHTGNGKNSSVLPTLTSTGNLIAGATMRVGVGFLLNPFSVVKAQFESNMYAYQSVSGALISITRQGPSELLRGFMASSLRDAPYAGLFIVFYEGIKRETYQNTSTFGRPVSRALAHNKDNLAGNEPVLFTLHTATKYHDPQQRGITGYFDGASLRLSRKVLSSAIGWAVYEGYLMFVRTHMIH